MDARDQWLVLHVFDIASLPPTPCPVHLNRTRFQRTRKRACQHCPGGGGHQVNQGRRVNLSRLHTVEFPDSSILRKIGSGNPQ